MTNNRVFRAAFVSAVVLLVGACATQPEGALLEKKFQRAAKQYDVNFMYEGQAVYCNRGATRSMPLSNCVTESQLRAYVEDVQRSRNTVTRNGPQYVATVPGRTGG